jgi:glucose-1-phosphate thymidylyltransferase
LISTPEDIQNFKKLLKDGSQWDISLQYMEQSKPEGLAQAFLIANSFIGQDHVCLILGDNIFYGSDAFITAFKSFSTGATIFAYRVKNPEAYGVVEFDERGKAISLEEKPIKPKSNYVVPGIYLYDSEVIKIAKNLKQSNRSELEITDVNSTYLKRDQLQVHRLERGFAWLDSGTSSSLHEAASFVQTLEKRQGIKIGCPEEAAWRRGFINAEQIDELIGEMPPCDYRDYLTGLRNESVAVGAN